MTVKFIINDAYTWYNKGDASIVIGIIKLLQNNFSSPYITILSITPEIDAEKYQKYNVCVKERLFNTYKKSNFEKLLLFPRYLMEVLLILLSIKFSIFKNIINSDVIEEYNNSDVVISCGGGFLGGNKISSILINLFPLYYVSMLNKPVFILGQSIEPFKNKMLELITKYVLNKIDLIFVREEYSYNVLVNMGLFDNTLLTFDSAFLIDTCYNADIHSYINEYDKICIGLTVRKWNFPGHKKPNVLLNRYLLSLKKTIEYWVSKKNAKIFIFPQVILKNYDDDRIISLYLYNELSKKAKENTILLTEDYSPEELKYLISYMKFFIGTRMHSNIFSLSMNVPVVAIAYETKTFGIMKMLDLENYVIDISLITPNKLINMTKKVYKSCENIKINLNNKISELNKMSLNSIQLMKIFIYKKYNKVLL